MPENLEKTHTSTGEHANSTQKIPQLESDTDEANKTFDNVCTAVGKSIRMWRGVTISLELT